MKVGEFLASLRRVAVDVFSYDALERKLRSGKKLIVKHGADPSRPDLHLGHSVQLRLLRKFQELGHEVVFVIGDFTGMIGDPSGRSKTRPALTLEQTRQSGETYLRQVTKILDPQRTRIVYNSGWLNEMNFADVIELAGKYTLARVLERDDFAKRYGSQQPIGLHEILYPLVQGYDSVALQADIETGGTDQTFNLLVGRELQKDYGQEQQTVITMPLLTGLDGREKMSKSLDNYIGIDEPAAIMFEKAMRIPDEALPDYFRLTTDIPQADIALLCSDVRAAHFAYAREIVAMYHGKGAVAAAEERYKNVASGKIPEALREIALTGNEHGILELLLLAGFAASRSEARRLIAGRGVRLDGKVVEDATLQVQIADTAVLQKGKAGFVKFVKS